MDRFFKNIGLRAQLPSTELHITGIVAMFVASKYEDVVPLLMRTVVNKIGHGKFPLRQIEEKELDILKVLEYRLGVPTIKEYMDRYLEEIANLVNREKYLPNKLLLCTMKTLPFSYELSQLPP